MSTETHKHLKTGRYWFTSPEYPEPQVLWYCGLTNTVMILGMSTAFPLDATIRIISPCQFVTVLVTERNTNDVDRFRYKSSDEPVVMSRPQIPFYDIDIDLGETKLRFLSAAKTYEKRRGYEESNEFEIMKMDTGSIVIHRTGRATKTMRQADIGDGL